MENGKKTTEFDAHCGDVVTISLAPDGNTYLTGSVDKTCKLWDVRETSPRQVFVGHSADVNSVCVSAMNRNLTLFDTVQYYFSIIRVVKLL